MHCYGGSDREFAEYLIDTGDSRIKTIDEGKEHDTPLV
jgi:hypothetical protein